MAVPLFSIFIFIFHLKTKDLANKFIHSAVGLLDIILHEWCSGEGTVRERVRFQLLILNKPYRRSYLSANHSNNLPHHLQCCIPCPLFLAAPENPQLFAAQKAYKHWKAAVAVDRLPGITPALCLFDCLMYAITWNHLWEQFRPYRDILYCGMFEGFVVVWGICQKLWKRKTMKSSNPKMRILA